MSRALFTALLKFVVNIAFGVLVGIVFYAMVRNEDLAYAVAVMTTVMFHVGDYVIAQVRGV